VVDLLHLAERVARADAPERDLALGLLALEEVRAVRRDDAQPELVRELDQDLVERLVLGEAVVLELDEEALGAVDLLELEERRAPRLRALLEDGLGHDARHARRETDDALGVLTEELEVGARLPAVQAL